VASVRVDLVSGNHDMIRPGDRVDVMVYLIRRPGSEIAETAFQEVLQDVKVFAVNDEVGTGPDEEGRSGRTATISLVVTPEQAGLVALASEMGKIRLFLRSPDDDEKLPKIVVKPSKLLGSTAASDRKEEELVKDPEATPKEPTLPDWLKGMTSAGGLAASPVTGPGVERHEMMLLQGSKVDHVVLERHGEPSGPGQWHITGFGPSVQQPPVSDLISPASDGDSADQPKEETESSDEESGESELTEED
jgi:hypothetical protein